MNLKNGFHSGNVYFTLESVNIGRSDSLYSYIDLLKKGGSISCFEWSGECWGTVYLFMVNDRLFKYDDGSVSVYRLKPDDIVNRWFVVHLPNIESLG